MVAFSRIGAFLLGLCLGTTLVALAVSAITVWWLRRNRDIGFGAALVPYLSLALTAIASLVVGPVVGLLLALAAGGRSPLWAWSGYPVFSGEAALLLCLGLRVRADHRRSEAARLACAERYARRARPDAVAPRPPVAPGPDGPDRDLELRTFLGALYFPRSEIQHRQDGTVVLVPPDAHDPVTASVVLGHYRHLYPGGRTLDDGRFVAECARPEGASVALEVRPGPGGVTIHLRTTRQK